MIEAILHGKLSREQENMEDLLTSSVFGALQHLDPCHLGCFLAQARSLEKAARPLNHLREARHATYQFWPGLRAPSCIWCEPDVLITLEDSQGKKTRVLVEAKYRSGKSSEADDTDETNNGSPDGELSEGGPPARDQLAREWENLAADGQDACAVVYLTAQLAMPHQDIEDALRELGPKRKPEARIYWLSWRRLYPIAAAAGVPPLLASLARLLERLGLVPFDGCRLAEVAPPAWRFEPTPTLAWGESPLPRWQFEVTTFAWPRRRKPIGWRFECRSQ